MKIRNLILVLSALTLPLQAADVGTAYLNLPIAVKAGETKLVGVFLARPALLKGELQGAVTNGASSFTAYSSGSAVFSGYIAADESTSAKELAPATDDLYVIEVTSGPNNGLVRQVSSFSGNVVNVKGTLPALADKTQFILRKDNTLASVFGNGSTVTLATGTSTANADVVTILTTTGLFKRFFYRAGSGWRLETDRLAGGADRANVRISVGTGILFKTYTNKNIYLSGEYRGTRSLITVNETGTIVANPYPVAVALGDSGLSSYLTKDVSSANADTLKFLDSGTYVTYHHNGTDFVKSIGGAVSNTKQLGVGDAFILTPQVSETVAFAPQVITK